MRVTPADARAAAQRVRDWPRPRPAFESEQFPQAGVTRSEASPLLAELVIQLAPALDAVEGNGPGHSLRTALISMRLAQQLELDPTNRTDLFYASLLKDLGAANAKAKAFHYYGSLNQPLDRGMRHADLTKLSVSLKFVKPLLASRAPLLRRLSNALDVTLGGARAAASVERGRSRYGASLALDMGFSHGTANAIRTQNERWDGRGRPAGLSGEEIPLSGRILNLAQELAGVATDSAPAHVVSIIDAQAGKRFDPALVMGVTPLLSDRSFLSDLAADDLDGIVLALEPAERISPVTASRVDRLLTGFARLIDAKSPWTYLHSERVRDLALGAASQLADGSRLGVTARRRLARAALLHDLGRITAPNELLDSTRTLTKDERELLRGDGELVRRVTEQILCLADRALITDTFAATEEPHLHDLPRAAGNDAARAELERALIMVAERFEALTAPRPQRAGMGTNDALAVLSGEVGSDDGPRNVAFSALQRFLATRQAATLLAPRAFDASGIVVVD